ncbi:MAG: YebC/PmpR family DNA-binding transcriptional regulator [Leptolyngbya sp. SIO4C1]|nr:YebC/PmpR family DNA-binding transcriptional regulator [Leptolyngbya sp. SIO4C1]
MAGHSKWANIKRQKARVDEKKGKVFAKLSREIIVAAKQGTDPAGNFQLRTAIEKAKAAGVPNDNIDRAIAKGSGQLGSDDDAYEAIRYEGYGAGGVAVLIEALTDNRNRTAADLRSAFSKNGGNLGETGCVGWMFEQKGVVVLAGQLEEEALLETALEGGAESYELTEIEEEMPGAEVFGAPTDLEALSEALKAAGYDVREVELRWIPSNFVDVSDSDQARALLKMMEALDDLDDVQSVTANFDLADEVMAVMA